MPIELASGNLFRQFLDFFQPAFLLFLAQTPAYPAP
jgi:hypothetical protein